MDAERGRRRATLDAHPTTSDLVACLVEPYRALLTEAGGRAYVRIVAQLRGRFAAWRVESDAATTVHLAAILDELEARIPATPALRRERIVGMIMVLTGMVAERAGRIDSMVPSETTDDEFAEDLIAMCTAVVGN